METRINSTTLSLPDDLKNISPLMRWADFQVKTEAEQDLAVGAMAEIQGRLKEIEKKRDELFGPLTRAIRDFEVMVRDSYVKPLQIVKAALNDKIVMFWNAREAKLKREAQEAHEKKLADEKALLQQTQTLAVMTGNPEAIEEMVQREKNVERLSEKAVVVNQTVHTTSGTLCQVKVWKWKIVDQNAIPRQFLMVDEMALNKLARGYEKIDPKPIIPGVEFFQEVKTALRA